MVLHWWATAEIRVGYGLVSNMKKNDFENLDFFEAQNAKFGL